MARPNISLTDVLTTKEILHRGGIRERGGLRFQVNGVEIKTTDTNREYLIDSGHSKDGPLEYIFNEDEELTELPFLTSLQTYLDSTKIISIHKTSTPNKYDEPIITYELTDNKGNIHTFYELQPGKITGRLSISIPETTASSRRRRKRNTTRKQKNSKTKKPRRKQKSLKTRRKTKRVY